MKLFILTSLLVVSLLGSSCAARQDFDARLNAIVKGHVFSIARWELGAIPHELKRLFSGRPAKVDDEIGLVTDYFAATERLKTLRSAAEAAITGNGQADQEARQAEMNRLEERKKALASTVERIIERQIRDTLAEQGIYNPLIGLKVRFPPVNFRLEKLPHALVISPREKIESIREITLKASLVPEEIEDIESQADALGVSSLVVRLGGLGATFPSLVSHEAGLAATINTAVEEWLHQYLAFKPLGFRYLLDLTGLSRDYEIATMNETVASMVSQEIGTMIYQKYYQAESDDDQSPAAAPEFDFEREMREIRKAVDDYLARGEIERAESFMEAKRQFLATKGYYIRKLNQAYFAFHGAYAGKPAFAAPIGRELEELRNRSASLKDFLDRVASMTSRQALQDSLRENGE